MRSRSTAAARVAASTATSAGCEQHQRVAGSARCRRRRPRSSLHDAAERRLHDVLHLHRLHHQQRLPRAHRVADGDLDADDRALQRRAHGDQAVRDVAQRPRARPRRSRSRPPARRRAAPLPYGEHRQRIARVDLRARRARAAPRHRGSAPRASALGARPPASTSSPTCSSTKRVSMRFATKRGWRAGGAGSGRWSRTPSISSSPSARAARATASAKLRRRRVADELRQQRVEARAGAQPA